MKIQLYVGSMALLAGLALVAAACGDDEPEGSGGSGATSSSSTAASTGSGGATGGQGGEGGAGCESSKDEECLVVCGIVYDCGSEPNQCPGFHGDPAEKEIFINGDPAIPDDACMGTCEGGTGAILKGAVFACDCPKTITKLKMLSPDFLDACDNGISGSGGAGGGGGEAVGGAGGAGGK